MESLSGAHSFATLFLRPKRVRKGFFGAFQGDSMHFRGHSRRIALLLPPFVVYYRHRAVLCSICHSRNSYRAENRPVTANRAVFCFLRVRVVHRVVSAHLRGDSCPKPSKAGKTWYTGYNKSARLGGRLRRRESYAKTAHQHGSGAEHGTDRNAAARPCPERPARHRQGSPLRCVGGDSPQRRRFRRKQALQLPFSSTTPPVKMDCRSVRRCSGSPKL